MLGPPWTAPAGAALLSLLVLCGLSWPLPAHIADWHALTAFSDSHVWVYEQLWLSISGGRPDACAAGYPLARSLRAIGWGPALVFMPLRALFGALAAANLLQLLSLPATAAAAALLVGRWSGVGAARAALLGAMWALCPTLLGTFATGELPNTQAWLLPIFLLVHELSARRLAGLAMLGVVGLIAAFTSPYYALALPLMGGGAALVWGRRHGWLRGGLAPLVVLAGALSPAWWYFAPDAAGGALSVFRPARRAVMRLGPLPHPSPVARIDDLLMGGSPVAGSVYETTHVVYLGVALLLVSVLGLRRSGPGRWAGVALTLGGALLAMGPHLAAGAGHVAAEWGGIPLPVHLLEVLGYPTRLGGMYYRYAVVAGLGLVLLAGHALRHHHVGWLALLLGVQVADGVRESGPMWPRPSEPVSGAETLKALRGRDGAVLELPMQGPMDGQLGQPALLRAVLHGRPTTALPRANLQPIGPVNDAVRRMMGGRGAAALTDAGYRLVLLPTELESHGWPTRSQLEAQLGPPVEDSGLLVWDLGPASPVCQVVRDGPPDRRH